MAGDGTGDAPLRNVVGAVAPAWRPGVTRQLAFSTIDGRIELVDVDSTKTTWLSAPGDPPTQLVWSDDGQRLLALGERSLRVFDSNGNKLWSIGMPVGPSGVVFVRKSHRFILIRYSTATQRSDLVLFQAETTPGEPRFLYSAPGRLRDAGDLPERRVAARRLGQREPVAVPAPHVGQGRVGVEHRRAVRRLGERTAREGVPE